MFFHPMQGTLNFRTRRLLRWSKLYGLVILASAVLVQSTNFVPLVQREGLCISEELRKDILRHCEEAYLINKTDTEKPLPRPENVPCHSKDIQLDDTLVTRLYDEIEHKIKGPLMQEYRRKCKENKIFFRAQMDYVRGGYLMNDDITNSIRPENVQLEFPIIGFRASPKAYHDGKLQNLPRESNATHWIREEENGEITFPKERSEADSRRMIDCKMYLAENGHGCTPHKDFVMYRTNKQNIPVVLSVSIFEPEVDCLSLRYENGLSKFYEFPRNDKMVPLNRVPGQVTLLPPGIGHDVVPPKTGKRISITVLCEFMHPKAHKLFQEDQEVQNLAFNRRKLAEKAADDKVDKLSYWNGDKIEAKYDGKWYPATFINPDPARLETHFCVTFDDTPGQLLGVLRDCVRPVTTSV